MIKNPVLIVAVLLIIECSILFVSSHPKFQKYFTFIPSLFWIYFLPMLASTFGWLDAKSPVYSQMSNWLLPMSLFLLLVTVDIKAILRLGLPALMMFLIGGVGVCLGVTVAFALFKPVVGAQFWSGFGALAGSWTGGSANMIAVKEALVTPDNVFLPMVIVDTVVPYMWMGLLVIFSHHQKRFDEFNHSDRGILDQLGTHINHDQAIGQKKFNPLSLIAIIALGCAGAFIAKTASQFCPSIPNVITGFAWTIIIVSTLAIALSFTPIKTIESHGSSRIGYFILYFVLTTIGAKASISNIGNAFILIGAGFVIIIIHACVLLIAARLMKAPLFLVAVASQANVGGVASAPMIAEVYQKGFASVGLLLAILGNILGTYIGIATGQICRWIAGL